MVKTLRVPHYPAEASAQPATVCVTGATGFVAGHIIERLLKSGHTVHATCRNPEKQDTVGHLISLRGAENLKLFKADLLDLGSFDEAIKGCEYVIHTASPFIASVPAAQVEEKLLKPAVEGTVNVLNSVNKAETVKRVVLTSSCASIYGSPNERGEGHVFTEEDWNITSSKTVLPYYHSKKLAEEKAWEMMKAQSRWDLVTINPCFIIGPPMSPRQRDAESVDLMCRILKNEFASACPRLGMGFVDVRDVAAAHCVAMVTPSAKGRYIVASGSAWIGDAVRSLAASRPDYKVKQPGFTPPKLLLKLIGPWVGMGRDLVTHNVNMIPHFSNVKAKEELGLSFISIDDMLAEMADGVKQLKLA